MNNMNYTIAVVGIGAVGGYYGGKLAIHYSNTDKYETVFVARGENANVIRNNGLTLITSDGEQTIRPTLVSSNANEIGHIDFLLCCVKSYDLESSLLTLQPCITKDTVILPLINGLDAADRITTIFPLATVFDGCVYIVSRLTAPGVVTVGDFPTLIHFGTENNREEIGDDIQSLLSAAGINAHFTPLIQQRMWEKFLFVSPFATLTSYYNLPVSDIFTVPERKHLFFRLLDEVYAIAKAKNIALQENVTETISERIVKLPPGTTSSMHTDFQKKKKTELESLTGYVVDQGIKLGVGTPTYSMMFSELSTRQKSEN